VQFAAPALRAHAPSGTDQLGCLTLLTEEQLDAASTASSTLLKEQLRKVQLLLQQISQAQEALLEQQSNTKYQIRKMEVGSIGDFHKGLTDRIGEWPSCRGASFLTAVCCRVAQSGLREDHALRALQLGRSLRSIHNIQLQNHDHT
jgi:hypothetical protein